MADLTKRIATSSRKVKQIEINGLLIQVVRCHGSDKTVTVDLIITNNEDDKGVRLISHDQSCLFDGNGNRAGASLAKLANVVDSSWDGAGIAMISGVPTKASLEFQGVSPDADTIVRLDIRLYESVRNGQFTVSFRNLTIER